MKKQPAKTQVKKLPSKKPLPSKKKEPVKSKPVPKKKGSSSPSSPKTPRKPEVKPKAGPSKEKEKSAATKQEKGKAAPQPEKKNSFTLTSKNITVCIAGITKVISSTHANFKKVVTLCKTRHWSKAAEFLDLKVLVTKTTKAAKEIIKNTLPEVQERKAEQFKDKVLTDIKEGRFEENYTAFFDRCKANPMPGSVEQLFDFLKYIKAPIQEDGCFLAYKGVRHDFMDQHSGTYDNSPGKIVSMPRENVTYNPHVSCAAGLHVAAMRYAKHTIGGRLMLVKVDPADVVSVPTDYSGEKMRVCRYEVIKEIVG